MYPQRMGHTSKRQRAIAESVVALLFAPVGNRCHRGHRGRRTHSQSDVSSTAMKADWGMETLATCFMRFLPRFCFSRSFRLRVMSPP